MNVYEFKDSLVYIVGPCLKKKKKEKQSLLSNRVLPYSLEVSVERV